MEPLEDIASKAENFKEAEESKVIDYKDISKPYEGLVLLEEAKYQGGTSIKYWM